MTLESTNNKNRYIGNGSTKTFNFTFKIWKKNQIKVFVGDGKTETDMSPYVSVAITSTGGTVTFSSAPKNGQVVVIRRNMPYVQEDDYRNGSRFDAEDVEDRFDMDCAERQDLNLGLSRALKVPETSEASSDELVQQIMQAWQDVLWALQQAGDVTGATLVTAWGTTAARALQHRFADWINVKDFGAKGDGVTDDTAAIQAALDYANTVSDNRPVVAFGTFKISNTLNVGRPSSNRQDKPEQHFIFETIIVDAAHWAGASSSPAINLRGWRAIMEGPSKLQCNKACAGIQINTFGAKVINPAVTNFAPNSYGLTWTSGGNCVFNPMINHDRATEAAMLQQMATPGILCNSNSIDSKVFGGTIGNCSPGIDFKSGTSLNFIHGIHIYCGSSEHPVTDPVLVRYASTAPNYMFNCYYDSGHIDIEKTSLRISGGHFLNNSNIATLNGAYIRCHPEDDSGNFANLNVFNIHNMKASFTSGSHTIPSSFDYSAINNLGISGGQEFRYERQTKRILPNNYNSPFEDVYKPVGTLCRSYHVGSGDGVKISYLDNAIRIQNGSSNEGGARIFLGGGSSGIAEDETDGGQTWIYANATVHLECAGNYGAGHISGYVRPGLDDFDQLGTSTRRWKDFWCVDGTIHTSDARLKQDVEAVPDAVFRAWGKVGFDQYRWKNAVEKKGEDARLHVGIIAQKIVDAFESEGLDATKYGLLCYDEWEQKERKVKVVDSEAVIDDEDRTIEPEHSHEETIIEPAGSRYSLRYAECLCMEAAYQRWRLEQIESRLATLEVQ